MYNYRVTSFVTFSICFWFVEMTFVLLSWLYLDYGLSKFGAAQQVPSNPLPKRETSEESQTIKDEDSSSPAFDELSDTSRTFPTFSRQPPLRYSASRIKKERDTEVDTLQNIPPAVEADDEDEAADYVLEDGVGRGMRSDSGLGTSMESSLDASRARRRSHKRESPPEC
jgi:seipin